MLVAITVKESPSSFHQTRIFRDFFFFFLDSAWVSTEKSGTNCLEQLFHQAAFGREMRVPNSLNILKILQSWNGRHHLKSGRLASPPG